MKILGSSGLPVRAVGQTTRQRPHSVHVYPSSICFHVRSSTREAPKRSEFSRSTVASRPIGSRFMKKMFGIAARMWKCFEYGR